MAINETDVARSCELRGQHGEHARSVLSGTVRGFCDYHRSGLLGVMRESKWFPTAQERIGCPGRSLAK